MQIIRICKRRASVGQGRFQCTKFLNFSLAEYPVTKDSFQTGFVIR